MKLVIVSGLSGAGKTVALNSLEDAGAYCIDNLPMKLLPAFAGQAVSLASEYSCIAIGVDARNVILNDIPVLLDTFKETKIPTEIVFLEASDEILIKRFSETRRKHPLTTPHISLAEAIKRERMLLASLSEHADIHLDTTRLNLHQLRQLVRERVGLRVTGSVSLLFESFGFKYGMPLDVDYVFDMRCLPNPHWHSHLRILTGRDQGVIDYLESQPKVRKMLASMIQFLDQWIPEFEAGNRSYLTVATGCTGGQHRSVYMAEQLGKYFSAKHDNVLIRHRELLS